MKKVSIILAILLFSLVGYSQKDTTFTLIYEGKSIVTNVKGNDVTYLFVDGREVTAAENAKAVSCIDKMKKWCKEESNRYCRDVCMLSVVPEIWNPVCLAQWGLGCLLTSIFSFVPQIKTDLEEKIKAKEFAIESMLIQIRAEQKASKVTNYGD